MKDVIKKAAELQLQTESSEDELVTVTEKVQEGEKWDCESILSK